MRPPKYTPGTRDRVAGIARPAGLAVAAVTAVVVFVAGRPLLPPASFPNLPPPPGVAPLPPPPPPSPPPVTTAPTVDAGARSDAAIASLPADASVAPAAPSPTPPPAARAAAAPSPEPAETAPPLVRKDATGQQDKDQAREAWRRNRPDITAAGNKASMMIPIKGSVEGATYNYIARQRQVVVTLPRATSLNTMQFYRLKRDGFHQVWVKQPEKDAKPADGTTIKIGVSDAGEPQVEIRDEFVRVTVRRPDAAARPTGAPKAAAVEAAPSDAPPSAAAPADGGA